MTLQVAVLGAGRWGSRLARALANTPRARVALVVDPSAEARRRAEASGYLTASEPRAAFEDPHIGAVVIATPSPTHATLARAALEANRHVLVEKPLGLSVAEVAPLRALAMQRRRVLLVGHLLRYHPGVERLVELARSGELGAMRYLHATRLNLGTVRSTENAWWSLAPHDVSTVLAIVGRLPVRVGARGAAYLDPKIEDVVHAHLEFDGGVFAAIHVSWLDPQKRRQLTLVGSRRMATFDDLEPMEKLRLLDVASSSDDGGALRPRRGDIAVLRLEPVEPLAAELAHFVACVLDGVAARTGIDEGLDVVRVLEAGQRSLAAGGVLVSLDGA
ncbi:MAG: Gfo/Idh/MocA family oxidoreductase [Deltaproteobacteria bacterium]|nr:Gfo/Idh/MocA family oxidoreductase [Deltaproteobacteria bacterium]